MTEGGDDTGLATDRTPEEAFSLVSNETRASVLETLWHADSDALRFSELRERVGMRDSGNFNYHLEELLGSFVRKTDEAYELTAAGAHLMAAVESGAYTASAELGPVSVDADCPDCGGPVTAAYEDDVGRVACSDCGLQMFSFPMRPAAVADCAPSDLPDLLERWARVVLRQMRARICPMCGGRLDAAAGSDIETPLGPSATFKCTQCEMAGGTALAPVFIEAPRVAAFAADHGFAGASLVRWDHPLVADADVTTQDDGGAELTLAHGGERLHLDIDADLRLASVTRS